MAQNIIHLDMDAFYASVEVLDNPLLKGKPVIVGGGLERGVVSAASYEARKFGVHSAMPIKTALQRCPDGIFLPPRMRRYREVSKQMFTIFQSVTPLVEPISLDEAFLDVTKSAQLFGTPEKIAIDIKKRVFDEIGLTVSAGIAASKLIAKIASDINKPDGLTIVPKGKERSFLAPLPISKLWGVGKVSRKTLNLLGIKTIGDLCLLPLELLETKFGKHGRSLYFSARGIDDREVTPFRETKSIGNEQTFANDLVDLKIIRKELLALSDKVALRMRNHELAGKSITLKVKYNDFKQITRSTTVLNSTSDSNEIYKKVIILLDKTTAGIKPVRLLGVSLSHLQCMGKIQLPLFSDKQDKLKRQEINRTVDCINQKFGATTIQRGRFLNE